LLEAGVVPALCLLAAAAGDLVQDGLPALGASKNPPSTLAPTITPAVSTNSAANGATATTGRTPGSEIAYAGIPAVWYPRVLEAAIVSLGQLAAQAVSHVPSTASIAVSNNSISEACRSALLDPALPVSRLH
jgi:hypothetical protein